MAYQDRLRECIYRSPKGSFFTLQFDEIEIQGGKKVAIHELPQQDGAEVQDLGGVAEKYPLSCYFTGPDYDTQTNDLFEALKERGPGSLQHPRYGDLPVLPLTWGATENLVDGLGRANIKIEFLRVNEDVVFPLTTTGLAVEAIQNDSLLTAISGTIRAIADFVTATAADVARIAQNITAQIAEYQQVYADVLATGAAISAAGAQLQAEAKLLADKITNTIDQLIAAPDTLFNLLQEIIAIPGKIYTDVLDKINAFLGYTETVTETIPESEAQAVVAVHTATATACAAAVAVTIGEIQSRQQAVEIADRLGDLKTLINTYIETVETTVYAIPSADGTTTGYTIAPETLAHVNATIDAAIASTLERAYTLRSEVRYTLDSDRTPIDLLCELYDGNVTDLDAALDEFIRTNDLRGPDIILIPSGREVIYYE